jgi:hypothetical protein
MNQYNKSLENRCHHHENQDFTSPVDNGRAPRVAVYRLHDGRSHQRQRQVSDAQYGREQSGKEGPRSGFLRTAKKSAV